MWIEPFENVARIRNNLDADHCTQFALLAALETLGDSSLNEETVDAATGYTPGGTWPYTMLNWLAENGYEVRHFEDTDFNLFQTNPRSEFERQGLDAATIDYFFEISDFPREQAQLSDAIANPAIVLENRKPEISDIVSGLQDGWLPIVSLDATTLLGDHHEEFDGHVVLVTAASVDRLRLQDPGPPAHWDWDVTNEVVLDALRTPSDSSGTVTLIRRASIMAAGGDVHVRVARKF